MLLVTKFNELVCECLQLDYSKCLNCWKKKIKLEVSNYQETPDQTKQNLWKHKQASEIHLCWEEKAEGLQQAADRNSSKDLEKCLALRREEQHN